MFICGQKEFRINDLLFEDNNKLNILNEWCLKKLTELKELGCNQNLLTSVYLNFWNRSEGRVYIDILNNTTDINSSDWIRQLTGFPGPFYILCLATINFDNIELVLSMTENKM